MSFLTTLKNLFNRRKTIVIRAPILAGRRARLTNDTGNESWFNQYFYVSPPEDPLDTWRAEELNDLTLSRISVSRLVELLADVSPEVSRALWDFLRFCNPGYEIQTLRLDDSDEEQPQGQAILDGIIDILNDLYGSFDVVIGYLFINAFLRGGFFAEAVLDGRDFVDLVVPDAGSARFRKVEDEQRGIIWQLGQWQNGEFIELDYETVRYIPVDPFPGKAPYGRSLVYPAVFSTLFLIGLLHDLRRVIAQQGYPRLDLEIDLEQLQERTPTDIESDPQKWMEWINAIVGEVQDVYADLEPDDAYVHPSVVKVNRPVGTVDASSLSAVDGIIRFLERMATRALKSMPILMDINESATEAHANRQWEIHVAGIKSLQHLAETLLEHLFKLAIEAQGIQCRVQFRFAELRASERLRDAQAETMEIANASAKYEKGWISQDAASLEVTGSEADAPGPRTGGGSVPVMIEGDGDGEEADSEARRSCVDFNMRCPECDWAMVRTIDSPETYCGNERCKLYGVRFEQPKLPLKPLGKNWLQVWRTRQGGINSVTIKENGQ